MARSTRAVLAIGLLLAFGGCVDRHDPTALAPGGPDYTIADAATGWNPAFYWLPPIVPPFAAAGVFDATRAPVVRICHWSGGACGRQVAEYSMTGGTGGEGVTMDPLAEHYQVMWRTGSAAVQPLTAGQVYRVTVLLDGGEAGFADIYMVASQRAARSFSTPGYVPVALGTNFKIKFRIERQIQLLDLYIDHKADGPLGQELGSGRTYPLTFSNDPNGAFEAIYTDGIAAGVFSGERRFARANPVLRMVYADNDYFAVWAGRQEPDNSVVGAWLDAEGQTGDFRIVNQGQVVSRSGDAGVRTIPTMYKAAGAGELEGGWILSFDRQYDGVYVPEPGGRNTLTFTADGGTDLVGVYTDGGSGSFRGSLYSARNTSVITLLFSNTDYYAAFAGAMTDPDHIVGAYFDAEGFSGDFVLTRRYREDFGGADMPSGWQATGGAWTGGAGELTGSFTEVNVDPQVIRTNSAGTPVIIRARILNTPGAPQGTAGIVFNWSGPTDFYAIQLRTNAPVSAEIVSYGATGFASCPAGLAETDTWYVLELADTPTGLRGRLLDETGELTVCTMEAPGVHITNAVVGFVAYSGGGLVRVDWIEVDTN